MSSQLTDQEKEAIRESGDLHVRWVVPESFIEFPLEEDRDEVAHRLLTLSRELLPNSSIQERSELIETCLEGFESLVAVGVEYASLCLTEIDGVLCIATVYVALHPGDERSETSIASLAHTLNTLEIGDVSQIRLPAAPALACIGARHEVTDGGSRYSAEDTAAATSFIQVYLPLPNGTVLAMEMATPTMSGWKPSPSCSRISCGVSVCLSLTALRCRFTDTSSGKYTAESPNLLIFQLRIRNDPVRIVAEHGNTLFRQWINRGHVPRR